ncbi:MAG: fasciclin domain-containing protein [Saprospiraceae bacterium]|nr:fasciclin domain-containing protein [Bacteroidia bacterium]NNE13897.1 fasciclin domain-containing protein [Saprospiraceae bacterium]NNL92081.1 fasciclin domain-containing protein [Saprospiraceae bacterium]
MKLQSIILSLSFILLSNLAIAQCGSHSKTSNASWNHQSDLVDIVSGSNDFTTLTVALKTAGLVKTLQGDGPFTVFAPTNSAFAKLPDGTVATLLKPENKSQLSKILTYHVVEGRFTARDIINAIKSSDGSFEVKAVSGDRLTASIQNDTVILTDENGNKSAVLKTDLDSSNGIAHVIDSVVLPQ